MKTKKNEKSIKKNVIYNAIYQILILIVPLITAPYLSRVVGAKGIGIYSYTYSIVNYFMLICLLGVNNYGNRSIAQTRDNKEKISKTFWEIYLLQLIIGIIMLIIYISYVLIVNNSYRNIALIQSIFIISTILDINWFYFGIEEFKYTITRNIIVKVGSVILILLLVQKNTDLWKYVVIMSTATVASNLFLWLALRKRISFVKIKLKNIVKHIKPNLVLFVPVIAVSIYKIMDKIMLGVFSNIVEVGYYENAEKIINVPLALASPLGTVMLPRISNIIAQGKESQVIKYIEKSISLMLFLGFAMCFGLISISKSFAINFYGNEFAKSGVLMQFLALTIPFILFSNVLRTQYLIPKEKDKIYINSTILGAIMNLIMNCIFIPQYGSVGACYGTITAEFMVTFYQCYKLKNDLNILAYIKRIIPFFVKALIMMLIIYPIGYYGDKSLLTIAIQIVVGTSIYIVLNINYLKEYIDIKKIKNIGVKRQNEKN